MVNRKTVRVTLNLIFILGLFIANRAKAQQPQVEANISSEQWLGRDEPLVLRLNRPVNPDEGTVAVFIGTTDFTDLFTIKDDSLIYRPAILLLPSGETEISVYLVTSGNTWREIGRVSLKVRTGLGLEKASIDPAMTINNNGQIAEGHSPETNTPPRKTYQDFSGQVGLTTEHRRGNFSVRSQWDMLGVSEQEQALRFGERGNRAPKIDLSSYLLQIQEGFAELSVGHVSHGRQRHLINYYGSRGVMLKGELGSRFDFSAAAMNGTSIVGWDNFVGLNNQRHRIYSGTFGLDVLNRPGGLRLETSVLDGSLLPRNNFNQGNITDTEESQGFGLRLQASDPTQRLRLEGGFARSRFNNPPDPFLQQGTEVVPVRETTRNARYLDVEIGILQNLGLSQSWQANLSVNYRHERVDPLYRSVAAFARADYMENAVEVMSNIGAITMQYSHSRSEDNLDDIRSILKTKTTANAVNFSLPLSYIFNQASGPIAWLPQLNYGYNRLHQFGAFLPENGGFSEGHVPDQINNSHNAGVDWQANRWRFGYRIAFILQDNRQRGRENADFRNTNHSLAFGISPWHRLDLNFDLSFENAENKEVERTDLTRRYGFNFNLRTTNTSALNVNFSTTSSEDDANTSVRNNTFVNAQWSLNFRINRALNRQLLGGQIFIRYTRNESDFRDNIFGFANDSSNWTVNTGFNLSFF